jgi:hypothetical protein
MAKHGDGFFLVVRGMMIAFGSITAFQAFQADEPAWIVLTFALFAAVFLFEARLAIWRVLNPLISLAYLAHATWLTCQAIAQNWP